VISRLLRNEKSRDLTVGGVPLEEAKDWRALIVAVLLADLLSFLLRLTDIFDFSQPIAMVLLVSINVLLVFAAVLRAIRDWGY
jgi:hypothetical protein